MLRIMLKESEDECETWSKAIQISPSGTGVCFSNDDHIFQHSSGRIILPVHSGPFYGSGDHYKAYCLYSDDGGKTWQESRKKNDLPKRGAEEPSVVELENGSLLAVLRTKWDYMTALRLDWLQINNPDVFFFIFDGVTRK